jgi:hypothetical protein
MQNFQFAYFNPTFGMYRYNLTFQMSETRIDDDVIANRTTVRALNACCKMLTPPTDARSGPRRDDRSETIICNVAIVLI